jgi:hypothetical protein
MENAVRASRQIRKHFCETPHMVDEREGCSEARAGYGRFVPYSEDVGR